MTTSGQRDTAENRIVDSAPDACSCVAAVGTVSNCGGYPLAEILTETPSGLRVLLDRRYSGTTWVDHWVDAEDWYVEHVRPNGQVALVVGGW